MRLTLFTVVGLAAATYAYQVTEPTQSTVWSSSGSQTVAWQRVDTDATTFAIVLVDDNNQAISDVLDAQVDGTTGSTTVNPPSGGFPVGTAFRINFVENTQNLDTILAQSPEFNITQGTSTTTSSSSTSTTLSSTPTTSGSTPSSTLTVPSSSGTGTPLNPTTSDTSTTPTSSSAALPAMGMQTGFLGLLAVVAAYLF